MPTRKSTSGVGIRAQRRRIQNKGCPCSCRYSRSDVSLSVFKKAIETQTNQDIALKNKIQSYFYRFKEKRYGLQADHE